MLLLSRSYAIECAHKLPYWPDIHGHSYEIEIWVQGKGDYVIPMDEMDAIVKPVLAQIDHKMLNEIIPVPSSENIAKWIWNALHDKLALHHILIRRPTVGMQCYYDGSEE